MLFERWLKVSQKKLVYKNRNIYEPATANKGVKKRRFSYRTVEKELLRAGGKKLGSLPIGEQELQFKDITQAQGIRHRKSQTIVQRQTSYERLLRSRHSLNSNSKQKIIISVPKAQSSGRFVLPRRFQGEDRPTLRSIFKTKNRSTEQQIFAGDVLIEYAAKSRPPMTQKSIATFWECCKNHAGVSSIIWPIKHRIEMRPQLFCLRYALSASAYKKPEMKTTSDWSVIYCRFRFSRESLAATHVSKPKVNKTPSKISAVTFHVCCRPGRQCQFSCRVSAWHINDWELMLRRCQWF